MKRIVAIDGKSVFYRGYYAMGALSTSDGRPTGGVYGFAAIAMELIRKLNPGKVVVAWDKAGTSITKRKEIYAEYKAGRVKPPEDFFEQIPRLKELIEALGWSFVEADNFEADDIIGTLAAQVSERDDWEMFIISSDLDMLQVVSENVKVYRLLKGFSELEEIDIVAIEKKYGIKKEQFLDLKALKGDASDNIPGVPGIGEKGAVKLLNEFGTVENIYNNIEKVSGATKKKLETGKESALMSYQLAKIMTDAPVKLKEIPDFVVDKRRVIMALEKLEFKSLVKKFMKGQNEEFKKRLDVKSEDTKEKIEGRMPEDVIFSFDVKDLMHRDEKIAKKIIKGEKFYDLGQGSFLLNPLERRSNSEGELLKDEPGEMKEEYFKQQKEFEKYPKLKRIFMQLDMPMMPILYKIERKGMKIDVEYFEKLMREYEKETGRIAAEIYELAGTDFNINSQLQLSYVLFEKLWLPTKGIKRKQRGYSTGAKELEKLKNTHPIVTKIIEYRELSKLLSTYVMPLPKMADIEGRVHTTFTQNVTATGRLSSLNPNLQNIPTRTGEGKKIRGGFIADPGKVLISADYAQFELRLAAAMARDEALIRDFNNGVDIHKKTAAEVFGIEMDEVTKDQRRIAKVVNFGIIYGMSAKGLADATGMGLIEAKKFVGEYMKLRKPIQNKMNEYLEQARTQGFVETYFGRRRPTPDVKSANFVVRTGAERAAQNMPIQGTEADLVKIAMIRLDKELPKEAEMVMQVHDSVMVEVVPEKAEETKQKMKEVMEGVAPEFGVKLEVDVKEGKRWSEL